MCSFVREERNLREEDAERGSHEQLQPAVAEQDESGDGTAEGESDRAADSGVEPGRALEQPEFADDLRDLRVRTRHRREICGPGVGLTNRPEAGGLSHDGGGGGNRG